MASLPPDRARAVHDELAHLQQQVQEQTPTLRARRRDKARKRGVRRSLRLLIVATVVIAASLLALDVSGVRTDATRWYHREVVDPSQGR